MKPAAEDNAYSRYNEWRLKQRQKEREWIEHTERMKLHGRKGNMIKNVTFSRDFYEIEEVDPMTGTINRYMMPATDSNGRAIPPPTPGTSYPPPGGTFNKSGTSSISMSYDEVERDRIRRAMMQQSWQDGPSAATADVSTNMKTSTPPEPTTVEGQPYAERIAQLVLAEIQPQLNAIEEAMRLLVEE